MTGGYRNLRERMQRDPLPPWHERLPLAFWRGSTTSSKEYRSEQPELNRRYQLARLSRVWPDRLDARINRVCSAVTQLPANRWSIACNGKDC